MTTRGTRHAWDASRRVRKGGVRGQAKGIHVLNSTNQRGRLLLKQTVLPPKRRLKLIWREYAKIATGEFQVKPRGAVLESARLLLLVAGKNISLLEFSALPSACGTWQRPFCTWQRLC
jgi:hypothetical protein